ncbi:MAG: hypothetical protein LBL97_02415 [Prevotellaceae bacterium]|jgi:hypothetical protein|nr:hypothetical protein [Prevotellaceae bacterium]
MKRFFSFASMSLALVLLAGCGKDDPNGENNSENKDDTTTITIDDNQKQQDVYADITSDGVSFTTTGAWTSVITEKGATRAEPPTWITISPDHGDAAGNYTISITLETNLTGADRTAVITIVCGDSRIEISVTQKGKTESGELPKVCYLVTAIESAEKIVGNDFTAESYYFEYDTQNRLLKSIEVTRDIDNEKAAEPEDIGFNYKIGIYSYAGNTITVTEKDSVVTYSGETTYVDIDEPELFTLGADGYVIADDGNNPLTYDNGYLVAEGLRTATWTDGNLTNLGGGGVEPTEISYNSDWVNNSDILTDLNWIIGQSEWLWGFGLGDVERYLKAMGYVGKRSKNYMSHEYVEGTWYNYDYDYVFKYTDDTGLPKQVDVTYREEGAAAKTAVYTITYKAVSVLP